MTDIIVVVLSCLMFASVVVVAPKAWKILVHQEEQYRYDVAFEKIVASNNA